MGHDFVLRQMKCELQGHQHWEFKGNQFSPIQPELLFQFLQQNERKPRALAALKSKSEAFSICKLSIHQPMSVYGETP